ncbi:MAG: alcohol dehydrogenase catalytic domain-containing protein [Proteobacteria bacterium]|nr:alcohol dehydrogenase catalytic domain-containing protein [Pseudomonadota bacterium]
MRCYPVTAFGAPLPRTDRPTPTPQGTEVLVRITASGVCHSDLHLLEGKFDLGEGESLDLARTMKLPLTLGHEIAGEVAALGPQAARESGGVAVGARRVVFPWIGCGSCGFCSRGDEQLCLRPRALGVSTDGGYADHVMVPHPRYLLDFAGLPDTYACTLACSGLTAFGALRKVAPLCGADPLLIIGAGGVGLAGVRLAKRVTGIAPIVADVDPAKREAALAAGAAVAVDPAAPGAAKALIKDTGGGVAAALDFVGAAASSQFGLDVLRKGGRLVIVGLFGGSIRLKLPLVPMRNITIGGSYVGSLAELTELVGLAQAGGLPPMPVHPRALEQVNETLDALRAGRIVGRAVLQP